MKTPKMKRLTGVLLWLSMALCVFASGSMFSTPASEGGVLFPAPEPGNGWQTTTPEEAGFSSLELTTVCEKVEQGKYGPIQSLLIVRNGKLAFERYFRGLEGEDLVQLFSVTKSVSSLVLGVLFDKGLLPDVQTPIYQLLGQEYQKFFEAMPEKKEISLQDVLTMRAGFEWNENEVSYNSSMNDYIRLTSTSDPLGYLLVKSLETQPGSEFLYNGGLTTLLSAIAQGVSGVHVDTLAQQFLFEPLGIENFTWERTRKQPERWTQTGYSLRLCARDLLKIGQLVLDRGFWEGESLVSAQWLTQSTQRLARVNAQTSYGYQWWITTSNGLEVIAALGWGGQDLLIVPARNLVVVITATPYQDDARSFTLFSEQVLPLLVD